VILPLSIRPWRDLIYKTKVPRVGAIRKEENPCALYVLAHRERQPATKDNIVVVKADGILFIVFGPVVPLF